MPTHLPDENNGVQPKHGSCCIHCNGVYLTGVRSSQIRLTTGPKTASYSDVSTTIPDAIHQQILLIDDSNQIHALVAVDALSASEGRLRTILDHSRAMVYVVDKAKRLRFVNRRWQPRFGLTNEQVAGRSIYDFFPRGGRPVGGEQPPGAGLALGRRD